MTILIALSFWKFLIAKQKQSQLTKDMGIEKYTKNNRYYDFIIFWILSQFLAKDPSLVI